MGCSEFSPEPPHSYKNVTSCRNWFQFQNIGHLSICLEKHFQRLSCIKREIQPLQIRYLLSTQWNLSLVLCLTITRRHVNVKNLKQFRCFEKLLSVTLVRKFSTKIKKQLSVELLYESNYSMLKTKTKLFLSRLYFEFKCSEPIVSPASTKISFIAE